MYVKTCVKYKGFNTLHFPFNVCAVKEFREKTPFTIPTNNIKYLATLTKQVKDLYDKNFKSLKKEIGEDISCIWF